MILLGSRAQMELAEDAFVAMEKKLHAKMDAFIRLQVKKEYDTISLIFFSFF